MAGRNFSRQTALGGALLLAVLLYPTSALAVAPGAKEVVALTSENIAERALSVAQSTRTTGRCYAAVSRAVQPMGVVLTGASAYQAYDILVRDSRFLPLTIYSTGDLRRGDIIVYSKSSTHPDGHIAVYEGGFEEASDHVSAVTHTRAYGGATVFRLRSEAVALANEDYGQTSQSDYQSRVRNEPSEQPPQPAPSWSTQPASDRPLRQASTDSNHTSQTIRNIYRRAGGERLAVGLIRRCVFSLFKN